MDKMGSAIKNDLFGRICRSLDQLFSVSCEWNLFRRIADISQHFHIQFSQGEAATLYALMRDSGEAATFNFLT
jgi:hypothetical protein